MQRGIRGLTGGRRGDGACSSAEAQDGLQSGGGTQIAMGDLPFVFFFFFPVRAPILGRAARTRTLMGVN